MMKFEIESETLEYKKSTSELTEACISISSMLNKHGIATLYFGIKPNGKVVGQLVSESTLRDVSRKIYESIKPQVYPEIEKIDYEDKSIIKVVVTGEEKPYSVFGKYYIRTADEDREINPIELKKIFIENAYKDSWELQNSMKKIDDINNQILEKFKKISIVENRIPDLDYLDDELLKKLGLTDG